MDTARDGDRTNCEIRVDVYTILFCIDRLISPASFTRNKNCLFNLLCKVTVCKLKRIENNCQDGS